MTEFHMVQIRSKVPKMIEWGVRRRLDSADIGHLCHNVFRDLWGDHAPAPFRPAEKMGNINILGYADIDADDLMQRMQETGEPETVACIESIASKRMPQFGAGNKFAFSVVLPPVKQGRTEDGKRFERDAFLLSPPNSDRESVYHDWLRERLEGPVKISHIKMESFQIKDICRRGYLGNGKRPAGPAKLPTATFCGEMEVVDSRGFSEMIRRGIGRHKAFGYGAILLKPARSI